MSRSDGSILFFGLIGFLQTHDTSKNSFLIFPWMEKATGKIGKVCQWIGSIPRYVKSSLFYMHVMGYVAIQICSYMVLG